MKLLAKSLKPEYENDQDAVTLVGHLELGIQAALKFQTIALVICDRLGLKMTPEELANTVAFAIWIHDWGKVSSDFQAFIHSKSTKKLLKDWYKINDPLLPIAHQAIRHELLSVILAYRVKSIYTWLKSTSNVDIAAVLVGVITHHLKSHKQNYFDPDKIVLPLKIYTSKKQTSDFEQILNLGVKYFKLSSQLPNNILTIDKISIKQLQIWIEEVKDWCTDTIAKNCDHNLEKQKKIAAVKALVMSADLAASALFTKERGERDYTQWIKDALAEYLIVKEIDEVIKARLKGKSLLPFQVKEKEYSSRVLIVIAGCGAGKTIVPFVRFQRLIEQGLKAKMFFCYPTTATTSQGFEDYGLTLAEKALLSHSRVWVDYQLKFQDLMASYDEESDSDDDDIISFETKVEALKLWHSKLVFCTAHTVLGLIQNHRKGLYSFPAIAQGVFVFDEIHAYSPQLFSALLQFLRIFCNTPIVLMSASLTPPQERAIQDVLAETNESADLLRGPEEIEALPRYEITKIDNQNLAWDEIITEIKNGGKVLWITNQVTDSQVLYTEAKTRLAQAHLSVETLIYHSRFRYLDSIKQHEKLVAAFRGDKPVFAVTTQIAEMSLDISCTLLVSANAPMWTLIQRLGRLNRWINRIELSDGEEKYVLKTGQVCKALIYPWEDKHPYELEDLETGDKLLELLQNKPAISQQDLTEAITTLNLNPPEPGVSTWLDTWKTRQEALMPPAYTIQVILEEDVKKVFAEAKKSKNKPSLEVQKFVVSVRIDKQKTPTWQRNKAFRFYRVAPTTDIYYHPEVGAYSPKDEISTKTYGHCTAIQ
jgi:CRISPR-associated endonuclease/helicase Cas3